MWYTRSIVSLTLPVVVMFLGGEKKRKKSADQNQDQGCLKELQGRSWVEDFPRVVRGARALRLYSVAADNGMIE